MHLTSIGTVPLMTYADGKHEHIHVWNSHPPNATCRGMGCIDVGFRVMDEAVFNAWLEKLRWGATLVEWEQKRSHDEGYC